MGFPYSGSGGNPETVAAQIDEMIRSAMALTTEWRNVVAAGTTISSEQSRAVYQALASLRAYVEVNAGVPGLAAAVQRRFPNLVGFDPVAQWAPGKLAIEAFGQWFQANWPKRVTTTNEPAFSQFNAADGTLIAFTITLPAPTRTALLDKLNAVLAAFTPQS